LANQEVNDVIETKKGTNADITFLLLSLLKGVGINGEPVIFSTRTNGKIQQLYPILSQFNYVLARVVIGNQSYYLDATDPLRSMELLPTKALNTQGLVIYKNSSEWITFKTNKKYNNASLAVISLKDDGSIKGTFEDVYREYAGIFNRQDLNNKQDIEIAKEVFETEQSGITIDSVIIVAKDSIDLPLRMKAWVTSPSYAQQNDDLIYINPHILHRRKENPFKLPDRKFPIDYAYQRSHTNVTNITIPDNFEIKYKLLNRSFSISNYASYIRTIQIESNKIQMMTKLEIPETLIPAKLYKQLKDFTHKWLPQNRNN